MLRYTEPIRANWSEITERPQLEREDLHQTVAKVISKVRSEGDSALLELCKQFDKVSLDSVAVEDSEITASGDAISDELREAIDTAKRNIAAFHKQQGEPVKIIETTPGIRCWRKSQAIEKVGLYCPGGTAPLFSSVLMMAVPASIAGCKEIVLCTPPSKNGKIHPAILYCALICNVTKVFAVGGSQAIAAMAYGTESIPKVSKIFGPGNQYVTEAKLQVSLSGLAIDMPAGPSEVAVYADESAIPDFVAADLLSQAEHGADSQVVLVCNSEKVADSVNSCLNTQIKALARKEVAEKAIANSKVVVLADKQDAVDILNEYAAEHLILACENTEFFIQGIRNAGSVFIGNYSPEAVGDYASGTNHVLPTNGAAKAFSGVSLDSFVKKVTYQELSKDGLLSIAKTVEQMAGAEGLDAHKNAVTLRREFLEKEAPKRKKARTSRVERVTNETKISIALNLDGTGLSDINTGLAFFDHMLEQIARHGLIDLSVWVDGDLEVDEHHTIEDTGLALGEAFLKALGDKSGITRYAFLLPMDESLAQVALDFSGRSWLVWDASFSREKVGDVPTEMFSHFFKSFCDTAKCNLNIKCSGENEHHMIESIFKAFAKSIGMAVAENVRQKGVPSTKGTL